MKTLIQTLTSSTSIYDLYLVLIVRREYELDDNLWITMAGECLAAEKEEGYS